MLDDPCRATLARALHPFACEGHGLLHRPLGDRDALQPDIEAGIVHHREHRADAAMLLADQPAGRATLVAVRHDAGRRSVDAELMLDRDAAQVVAGAVGQDLRHQEQGYAARALRRIRQPRQHEVDYIVGEVVLAEGDEDLLAADPIDAVAGGNRAGLQRADVGAGLRLGQIHGTGPFAGDQPGQPLPLERFRSVVAQRFDGAGRQHHHQ
jgi:hypothetical protein